MSQIIIALIDAEIKRLQNARTLIAANLKGPGRPAKSAIATTVDKPKKKKKRNLSPEGRARIAAAVKARWAAQNKKAAL